MNAARMIVICLSLFTLACLKEKSARHQCNFQREVGFLGGSACETFVLLGFGSTGETGACIPGEDPECTEEIRNQQIENNKRRDRELAETICLAEYVAIQKCDALPDTPFSSNLY